MFDNNPSTFEAKFDISLIPCLCSYENGYPNNEVVDEMLLLESYVYDRHHS